MDVLVMVGFGVMMMGIAIRQFNRRE